MYDDLLGPRKEKGKRGKIGKRCIDADCKKPAQPEKFDSHKSNDEDAWADVGSDIGKEDLEDIADQIEDLLFEEDEELEICDGGDACDNCADEVCPANENEDLSELEDL